MGKMKDSTIPEYDQHSHDPLCGNYREGVWFDSHICVTCDLIAKVRKDQTQRCIEQVQRMCAHTKYEGCLPCVHDEIAASLSTGLSNDSAPDPASTEKP
jgi:hypothetical protein